MYAAGCVFLTLQQAGDPGAHAHVQVGLGGLDVVVQVVAEAHEHADHLGALLLRLHVAREDG